MDILKEKINERIDTLLKQLKEKKRLESKNELFEELIECFSITDIQVISQKLDRILM